MKPSVANEYWSRQQASDSEGIIGVRLSAINQENPVKWYGQARRYDC